ncbi:MAG: leucine-rich repeat protein, partial [Candidatus Enterosoma sp.]|nr:leucine-rich repeat protein [Candidatus Enterosoma sp.]
LSVPQGNSNTVRFEATTTKIDKDAFVDCDKISYVIFTESITDIDPETFKGMTNIDTISPNSMILNDLDIYFELNNIHTISLQDDLDATYFLAGIDKEGTPKDYIDALPDDLSIVISSNNQRYTNIDGVIYSKDSAYKAIYRVLKSVQGDFVIPNDVNIISVNAFKNNQLTSVYIPASVTHIKANAFTSNRNFSINIQKNSKEEFREIADNWTNVDERSISWGVGLNS